MSGSLKILFAMAAHGSYSERFVWELDLIPFSGAVLFFASRFGIRQVQKQPDVCLQDYRAFLLYNKFAVLSSNFITIDTH